MTEKRKGRQTPTKSVILPYEATKGPEAVELYEKTGRTAQEWQKIILYDILATTEDGLWAHIKFGYSIPRRNGKSEILAMRELYGLINGEKILHSAHRTSTSSNAWNLLCTLLEKAGYEEKKDFKTLKRFGMETITMTKTGGQIHFRTRSSKSGLGEGFDLLVVDEAQEYTTDQEGALQYVVTSSSNPQTLMCGTPPTVVSSGTVFTDYRTDTLAGNGYCSGWAEWSVDFESDPEDVDLWYQCNPSLGEIFTERNVRSENRSDVVDFNIQRLGLWLKYNQKSAISAAEWDAAKIKAPPTFTGPVYAGIKYGHNNEHVSLSIAVQTTDGRTFVETIDCQPIRAGDGWLVDYLKQMKPKRITIDGRNGQNALADELRAAKVRGVDLPKVAEVVTAAGMFEQSLFNGEICHNGQPSLAQSASNCEHRAIGSGGGFGYQSIKENVDVTLLESAVLAFWTCQTNKGRKTQTISY